MISMSEARELAKIAGSVIIGVIVYRWYVYYRATSEERKKKKKRKRRKRWY